MITTKKTHWQLTVNRVTGLDDEAVFWMKEKIARSYLATAVDLPMVAAYMRSSIFWTCWHRWWATVDSRFPAYLDSKDYDTCNMAVYEEYMQSRLLDGRWTLTKHFHKLITDQITDQNLTESCLL